MIKGQFFKSILTAGILLLAANVQAQKYWIVGGGSAKEGEFPWMSDLRGISGYHICGGALIAPQWVVTAAHCMYDGGKPGTVTGKKIRINSVNTKAALNPSGGVEVAILEQYIHPDFVYINPTGGADIALLKIASTVSSIAPISVVAEKDSTDAYITNAPVKVAGWGLIGPRTYKFPDTLKWVTSKVYDFAACSSGSTSFSSKIFCLGYTKGEDSSGSGSGDSGGPAWRVLKDGTNELIGVVSGGSYGLPATSVDTPGLFTKIAYFKPWIDSVTGVATSIRDIELPENLINLSMDNDNILLKIGYTTTQYLTTELYDMNGVRIYTSTLAQPEGQTVKINASSLAAGMYAVKITDAEGRFLVKKIFKY